MNELSIICIFLIMIIAFIFILNFSLNLRFIQALLTENGTCISDNLSRGSNQVINGDQFIGGEEFKNITRDNRQLAELICQNRLNETIGK
jgi:hypothetical protein